MSDKKGQALVELAYILPILFLLLFGIVDFGRYIYVKNSLMHAAALGARVAAVTQPLVAQGPVSVFDPSVTGEPVATMRQNINGGVPTPADDPITYQIVLRNAGSVIGGSGVQAVPGNQVQVILNRPNFQWVTPLFWIMAMIGNSTPPDSKKSPITCVASMSYE